MRCARMMLPLRLLMLFVFWAHGQRIWRNYGPLYESTKLLIEAESLKASETWNRTQESIHKHTHRLILAKDALDNKQLQASARISKFFGNDYTEEWRICSKKYELQVAHFNRELLDKYSICRNSLDSIMDHFEQDVVVEGSFLNTASQEIEKLSKTCQIWQLKQAGFNHAGVLLCTVSGIGRINQRITTSLDLCDAILLEMSMEDLDTPSCLFYYDIKMQFDEVFFQIESCALA
ncbi:uncharacterized protein LOC6501113 [Drosophila ananassae]|uniref:uncharacterized protein LOC6501113 n=1 Tax=Drosophila ananassae TaxID=7217 RepID=UPI0013A5EA85|nr:uncharacterized protein LOC6501113 [Drosophila ananassae]